MIDGLLETHVKGEKKTESSCHSLPVARIVCIHVHMTRPEFVERVTSLPVSKQCIANFTTFKIVAIACKQTTTQAVSVWQPNFSSIEYTDVDNIIYSFEWRVIARNTLSVASMPLGKLSDLLFNFTLRSLPPPPPPIPLPPPPSCALVPYGPYLVSRTEDFAAPSARFHSASAPSGDILAPLRSSFVIGIIVFIIGLLGLGCGCYLVFDRASRGVFSNPRTKPTRKPGTTSLLLARSSAALRTLIHVAAMSCCLYGVIQFMQCIVFGVCLTSNTEAATVLVDLEPQIMVDNLRQFFGTVKDFIYSVDHERFRDRDFVDRISLASVTVVTERLASLLHGVCSLMHNIEGNRVLDGRLPTGQAPVWHDALSDSIRSEAMASYTYEVLRVVSLLLSSTLSASTVPPIIRGVVNSNFHHSFAECGFCRNIQESHLMCSSNRIIGTAQNLFTALAADSAVPSHLDAMPLVAEPPSSPECILDTTVSPQLLESADRSHGEFSEDVPVFRYVVKTAMEKKASPRQYSGSIPRVSSPSATTQVILRHSQRLDIRTRIRPGLTGELTPATSVPDVSLSSPLPKDTKSDVSESCTPQDEDIDHPAVGSSVPRSAADLTFCVSESVSATTGPDVSLPPADTMPVVSALSTPQLDDTNRVAAVPDTSGSATDPLVAPVGAEGGWKLVTHKKWKRRIPDTPHVSPSADQHRPQCLPRARRQAPPSRTMSPAPSRGPSEALSFPLVSPSSKLSLGSLRSNRTPSTSSVSSLQKPAKITSSSSSEEVWYTVDGEFATEDTKFKLNKEWFPPYPSRNIPLPPMSAWFLGPDWESKIQLSSSSDGAVKECVEDRNQGVEELPPSSSYDSRGNFARTMQPKNLFGEHEPTGRLPRSSTYDGKAFTTLSNEDVRNPLVVPSETRTLFEFEDVFQRTGEVLVKLPRAQGPRQL
ncbi:hypothetical protein BD410DRAFT_806590 [Rickenella mellea]|uniref:Uncharacterized protein n=1 Tax=Rickenella mellea TaxID=50990 RepID=A0A4Y7PU85_9AGAM|nr:hypothetical protein BD410DRAFT_806590 [Rickenella mellea]